MIRLLVSCGSECRLLSATVSNRYSQLLTNNHKYLSRALFSSQSAQSDDCYDIVINGGGIVGFSTLLALKRSPFLRDKKICLFERQSQPKETKLQSNENHFSNRVSSITKSSKKFFENIGVWNELEQFAKPVKEFYVWSQKYQSGINFRSDFDIDDDIRDDNNIVCYVIENNKILSSLQTAINQSKQNVCYETVVTNIAGDDHCIQIETKHINSDETNKLRTRLLIGSDGFQSIVRQKSNLELFEHDLEQFGIVGTVAVDPGEGNITNEIAFQRFVPFDRSVIALLPLNQDFSSFVWSVPKDSAKHLMEMSDHQFVDHMNDSLFVESNGSSASMRSKIDDLISRFVPKQLVEEPIARYAVPHVVSLLTDSRAMFPLKFSTTVPYLIGSPSDSKDNNRIVIIGKFCFS